MSSIARTRMGLGLAAIFCTGLFLAAPIAQRSAAEFFAAPDGHPDGDGSLQHPWDLQTALNQPTSVRPGATIWLRGGTYTGSFVSRLTGQENAYITIRAYAKERPTLDTVVYDAVPPRSPLRIEGPYVTVWGLEITSSNPMRVNSTGIERDVRPIGINVYAPHTKLINNIVHDMGDCVGHWVDATDAEVYGNLIYFCGWDSTDRGHGHGLYIQNAGGTKEIRDNIIFDEFAYGIHAYTERGALDDLRFRRNVVFESSVLSKITPAGSGNILVGGRKVARRPIIEGNYTYRTRGSNGLGYRAGTDGAVVTGNYFIEGKDGVALGLVAPQNLSLTGNVFFGPVTRAEEYPDNRYETAPHGIWPFVLPNAYDPSRATLVIYNWDAARTVSVDLSSFLAPGDVYELHNVQNYFGDVVTRTYAGGAVDVPMQDHTVGVPVGWHAPPTTFPTFGAFVVVKTP